MKHSFACLIVPRTMAHMDTVFFCHLAFVSMQGEKKENMHSDRAMLFNIREALAFPPWSTNEKNTIIWFFLKGQFSCFSCVYTYNVIVNNNKKNTSAPFRLGVDYKPQQTENAVSDVKINK